MALTQNLPTKWSFKTIYNLRLEQTRGKTRRPKNGIFYIFLATHPFARNMLKTRELLKIAFNHLTTPLF